MIRWHLECSCKTHACVRGPNRPSGQLNRNNERQAEDDNHKKNALKLVVLGLVVAEAINQELVVGGLLDVCMRALISPVFGVYKGPEQQMSPRCVRSLRLLCRLLSPWSFGQCFQLPLCVVTSSLLPPMYPCPHCQTSTDRSWEADAG